MKYFYFIIIILLVTFFFIFSNLNPTIIALDLFFVKIEGISFGFSMIFSVLVGFFISLILQLPLLIKRKPKAISNKKDEKP